MNKKTHTAITLTLAIIIIILTYSLRQKSQESQERHNLIEAIQDTLKTTRGKMGEHIAKITVLETRSAKDFLSIQAKEEEITRLQKEVERYKRNLKEQGSVTTVVTEIKLDTIWTFKPPSGDTVILSKTTLLDSIKNEWIDVTFGFINSNSTLKINNIKNEYTIAIGREKQGLFKPTKPFVEITSYNPYSTIQTVRTYQISTPPPKKWGLGVHLGYGIQPTESFKPKPIIGIGLNYNIIQW